MSYRFDRSLLLETDPAKMGMPPLTSLRDADVRHQQFAAVNGYNSVFELAVDEMLVMVRDLTERLDRLEAKTLGLGEIVP